MRKSGQYSLGNILYYPAPNVMVGTEIPRGPAQELLG